MAKFYLAILLLFYSSKGDTKGVDIFTEVLNNGVSDFASLKGRRLGVLTLCVRVPRLWPFLFIQCPPLQSNKFLWLRCVLQTL